MKHDMEILEIKLSDVVSAVYCYIVNAVENSLRSVAWETRQILRLDYLYLLVKIRIEQFK